MCVSERARAGNVLYYNLKKQRFKSAFVVSCEKTFHLKCNVFSPWPS